MKSACIILTFILCFFFGDAQDCTTSIQNVTEAGVIQYTPYPIIANDSCNVYTWSVSVEGYNVDVTINYLDLDATTGDYLTISPGSSLAEDETTIVITGKINSKKFRVMRNNEMFLALTIQNRSQESGNFSGFKLSYSAYGEITSEPPSTIPTTPLPIAPPYVEDEAMLYIANITPEEFAKKIDDFKQMMATVTDRFCETKGIALLQAPSAENVIVELVTVCPYGWPNWDNCTKIQLKIPLFVQNNDTYELTGAHIREMWNSIVKNELAILGMQVYETPNADATMLIWVYIAVGTVVVFGAVLIIIWRLYVFISNRNKIVTASNIGRESDMSIKSWISETTYEVPPMMYDENLDKPINHNLPTTLNTNNNVIQFKAREFFPTKTAHDNFAFDSMSERIPDESKDVDDFSSDEESSLPKSSSTKSNQYHLYEAPMETDDGNYSIL